jgi:hypothetical protein
MADTLLSVINEILVATQQREKTAFSANDDTRYLIDRVNDALNDIYTLCPETIDANGTITITPSTRLFNGPSGLDVNQIYEWSFRIDDTEGDIEVSHVPKSFIVSNYPTYETEESDQPIYVYQEGTQLGIYPLLNAGASNLTLQFIYPSPLVKLTTTTDTFPFQDRSIEMKYIKAYAQLRYEIFKGLGQPAYTMQVVEDAWATLVGSYASTKQVGFIGYRRYGN